MSATPACALSIAGSDSGGGAGLQADLKAFQSHGVHGLSAVTAVTAQNTQGLSGTWPLPPEALAAQLKALFDDFDIRAAKTGMLHNADQVAVVAQAWSPQRAPLVVDPVLSASSGQPLSEGGLAAAIRAQLFPLAALVTPNLDEAAAFLGRAGAPSDRDLMERACEGLVQQGARAVLLKGGHLPGGPALDLLYDGRAFHWFEAPRLATRNTHGTGCSLSAAITAQLALGRSLAEAVGLAKAWLSKALARARDQRLGKGPGPLDHSVTP